MSITIPKSSIRIHEGGVLAASVSFCYRGYRIALGLADCGDPSRLFCGEFQIYEDDVDLTLDFFSAAAETGVVPAGSTQLHDIFKLIDAKLAPNHVEVMLEMPVAGPDAVTLARAVVQRGIDRSGVLYRAACNDNDEGSLSYSGAAMAAVELAKLEAQSNAILL